MNELLNGTLAEAVEKLAAYAAERRTRPQTYAEKSAAGDFLSSLGDTIKNNPTIGHALIGGGLGAGLGGLSTAYGNSGKDDSQKRSILSSMLTGGLAGAGVGTGVGLARQGLGGLKGPDASMGSDALHAGEFVDPATGTKMRIDPAALKNNPDLHKQVKSLTTPSVQSHLAGGAHALWQGLKEQTPTSAAVMPWLIGGDAALHFPGIGLNRIRPGQAGGHIGRELFEHGLPGIDDKVIHPDLKGAMSQGLGGTRPTEVDVPGGGKGWTKGKFTELKDRINPGGWLGRQVSNLRSAYPKVLGRPSDPTLGEAVGSRAGAGYGDRPVASMEYTPTEERKLVGETSKGKEESKVEHVKPKETKVLSEGQIGETKRLGHRTHPEYGGRSLSRIPGTNITYAGAKSLGGAALGRSLGYAAPFGAEWLGRGMAHDLENRQTLRDLMAQHAKPVPGG